MSEKNIFQRMAAITEELTSVAKNLSVGEGRSSYKAVGEADVLKAVKPLEFKHGVYSYPSSRKIVSERILESEKEYKGQVTKSTRFQMRVETIYRFVNTDKPDEFIEITTYGDGVDSQDKAPGKAMTYADKYALLKAYKIITGEDPDQYASQPDVIEYATTAQKKTFISLCESMGKDYHEILDKVGVKGKMTVSQHAQALAILQKEQEEAK